jgi:hypothetical protein
VEGQRPRRTACVLPLLQVVVQLDIDMLVNVRHTLADKYDASKAMEGWTEFRQKLGLFFIEVGRPCAFACFA